MSKLKLSARNKKFWALSKPERRVAVAEDVLKQLDAKKIRPVTGDYLEINMPKITGIDKDEPVDKVLDAAAYCNACAIGSIFVGLVSCGNKVKAKDIGIDDYDPRTKALWASVDEMRRFLRRVFTPGQLTIIECAFEKNWGLSDDNDLMWDYRTKRVAAEFGSNHKNDTRRLRAIMQNIIDNKGEFKP